MTIDDHFNRDESQDSDSTTSPAVRFGCFSHSSSYDSAREAIGLPSGFPVLVGDFDDGLDVSGPASFSTSRRQLLSAPCLLFTVQVGPTRFTWLVDPDDSAAWHALEQWRSTGQMLMVLLGTNGAVRTYSAQASLHDLLAGLSPTEPVAAVDHRRLYLSALALGASRRLAWEMCRHTSLAASWSSEQFCVVIPSALVDAMTEKPDTADEPPPERHRVKRLLRPTANRRLAARQLMSLSPHDLPTRTRPRHNSRAAALSTVQTPKVRR